jgi:hypothetical protein
VSLKIFFVAAVKDPPERFAQQACGSFAKA